MASYDAALRTWPVPYQSQTLRTHFGSTHLISCGPESALPVLLLHGQESSATMWMDNIQALSQANRVYAIDTPGDIGRSRPTQPMNSRQDYAAWLLEVVDQLQLGQVDLIGISYGGFLALNFTLAFPERVKRLILLTPGIPNFGPPTARWAAYGMPMLLFPSRFTVKWFINGASTKGYQPQDPVQEQMIVSVPQLRKRLFLRPVFTNEELRGITTPCFLLIGDNDILYNPVQAAQQACQLIPNLTAVLIPNANHFLNSDQPEIVNTHLLRFLHP
ncbi:MAG TPA: alpha/beta hydrolase [Bacteroidales bacterium]|nr:alpha/beta hydrolase [Bacteroidales bacterium]